MKRYAVISARMPLAMAAVLTAALALVGAGLDGTAGAATLGEACMFNAPSGAITLGHVGWAFRVGTGNTWEYGATEGGSLTGISPGPPSTTQSWHATGTMAQMLTAFGTGVGATYNHGSGYYLSYRCSMVNNSNPAAAAAQASQGETTGYNVLSNNCLTKAVAIFQDYGVAPLPSGDSTSPNTYFQSDLPAYPTYNPGFNVPQWLTTLTVGVKLVDALNGGYLNTNPLRRQRPMHVQIYDASNHLVFDSPWSSPANPNQFPSNVIMATVTPGTDRYQAIIQLPTPTPLGLNLWSTGGVAGAYLVKVQLDYTLRKFTPGITLISQGASNGATDTNLTVGDINQDNQVNLTDYNLLLKCYSDILPPTGPCPSWQKTAADLNDDGSVNGFDYNIMLRIFQNQGGA